MTEFYLSEEQPDTCVTYVTAGIKKPTVESVYSGAQDMKLIGSTRTYHNHKISCFPFKVIQSETNIDVFILKCRR